MYRPLKDLLVQRIGLDAVWDNKTVVVDFEKAIANALLEIFPETRQCGTFPFKKLT